MPTDARTRLPTASGAPRRRALSALLVLALAASAPGLATADSGGPDGFGYSYQDSAEAGGPVYDFEDISAIGTPLSLWDDSVSGAISLGFSFPFYGDSYSNVYVSSNGFLTFDPFSGHGCCSGQPMGDGVGPGNLVAGFWTDLYPPGGGSVTVRSTASSFIAQFEGVPFCCTTEPPLATFQFKLFPDGSIEVHYASVDAAGLTVSAGIENADSTIGLQYQFGSFSLFQTAVRYSLSPSGGLPEPVGALLEQVGEEVESLLGESPGGVVYESDFSSGADAAWSQQGVETAPSGERFLGRFGNGAVALSLSSLPSHSSLTIAFDLYIIETWDGQGGIYQWHSDEWRLTGPSGETLVDTSFSNCDREYQDYPAAIGQGGYYATTGAQATGTLGYDLICYYTEGVGDSTYHFELTVQHSGPNAAFTFEGIGLQALDDESWGLDNVVVST